MEMRLNLVLAALLAFGWMGLVSSEPVAALDPAAPETRQLAELEDRFAREPGDAAVAEPLVRTYLELGRPGLAIAALRAGEPRLLEHPVLTHYLAQAYEVTGRVADAAATAELALARCARSLGTAEAPSATPVPRFECNAREHAALEVHLAALDHLLRWGVTDPVRDRRTRLAYDLATRRARIASAD